MSDLKVVIIGGGIAGLTVAVALKKSGKKVVVREKNSVMDRQGIAFMVHSKTLKEIEAITNTALNVSDHKINDFLLFDGFGTLHKKTKLTGWYAVKRAKICGHLLNHLSSEEYFENSDFSHFNYKGDKIIAAVFKNGLIEYGDFFIGADGVHSQTRKSVFQAQFYPNGINELVCLFKHSGKDIQNGAMQKYESIKRGISFGFVPLSNNECVWYLQFDVQLYGDRFKKKDDLENWFNPKFLSELPTVVSDIIIKSDLKNAHYWINKELKLSSSYYKNNLCLIGDAAHASISLTSSGVASGVSSAIELATAFNNTQHIELALENYTEVRKRKNAKKIEDAQILKAQFHIDQLDAKNYSLPLLKD